MKSYINNKLLKESGKYSPKAQEVIKRKMRKMKYEDMPQEQKAAIAIEEARRKGLKVPPKKKSYVSSGIIKCAIFDMFFKISAIKDPKEMLDKMFRYIEEIAFRLEDSGFEHIAKVFSKFKKEIEQMGPKFDEDKIKKIKYKLLNLLFRFNNEIKQSEKE